MLAVVSLLFACSEEDGDSPVFPFTGKEWHGIKGQNIKGTRKLLYIDWMKI